MLSGGKMRHTNAPQSLKMLFLIVLIGILVIPLSSADGLDIKLKASKNDMRNRFGLEDNTLWEKYSPIKIKTFLGLGKTRFEGALTEHTETCQEECYSIMN